MAPAANEVIKGEPFVGRAGAIIDTQGIPAPPDMPPLSEDFTMCVWAKAKLGISTLVDTSIVCRHIGLAQSGDNTFYPAETNPNT